MRHGEGRFIRDDNFFDGFRSYSVTHCVEITDELPPDSERLRQIKGLFLGFAHVHGDIYTMFIADTDRGSKRVFDLQYFGLTPERYRQIHARAISLCGLR